MISTEYSASLDRFTETRLNQFGQRCKEDDSLERTNNFCFHFFDSYFVKYSGIMIASCWRPCSILYHDYDENAMSDRYFGISWGQCAYTATRCTERCRTKCEIFLTFLIGTCWLHCMWHHQHRQQQCANSPKIFTQWHTIMHGTTVGKWEYCCEHSADCCTILYDQNRTATTNKHLVEFIYVRAQFPQTEFDEKKKEETKQWQNAR